MDACLYRGNEICSWELIDEDNQYNRQLLAEWKRASEKHLLFCKNCEEHLFLRAGNIREPHFAHAKGSSCPSNTLESIESMKGKRILVNLAKRSFPDVDIKTRFHLPSGNFCTVFIDYNKDIILDFHYNCLQNINYDERSKYYIDNGIAFLHVFSGNYEGKVRNVGITEKDTIQFIQGYCVFLNMYPSENKLRIYYQMTEKHPRSGKYEMLDFEDRTEQFIINNEGELCYNSSPVRSIVQEFCLAKLKHFDSIKKDIESERQDQEERKQQAIALQKQREEKEKEEIKKKLEEIEKRKIEYEQKMQQMRDEYEKSQEQRKVDEEKKRNEAAQRQKEIEDAKMKLYNDQLTKKLIREDLNTYSNSVLSIKLKIIKETWTLPYLLTRENGLCPIKDDIRINLYLKSLEFWLYFADDNLKHILINLAEYRINNYRFNDGWNKEDYIKDFEFIKKCKNCIENSEFICIHKVISHGDLWCDSLHACFVVGQKVCTRVKRTCDFCKYNQLQNK